MKNVQRPPTISLIGAGNLGKSLTRLWHDHDLLSVKQVFTRSELSAQKAVEFIGIGVAHTKLIDLQHSDVLLIAVPDDQIQAICDTLHSLSLDLETTVVFHCSGVMSSTALKALSTRGASIASVHPVKSFANPKSAITSFDGTFCGVEGDQAALDMLLPLFTKLGGQCIAINPDNKVLYHCAAVFANNYMVSLVESAQELYELSGIDRNHSMQVLAPMLRETCENIIKFGTRNALTGPIARGDKLTIEKHLSALKDVDQETVKLYQSLGKIVLSLKNYDDKTSIERDIYNLLTQKP